MKINSCVEFPTRLARPSAFAVMMRAVVASVALLALAPMASAHTAPPSRPRFKAVAFDYFVLFDPSSIVPEVEKVFPGKGAEFTKTWRSKQFEYGFLRSITRRHRDFFAVTGDALDYTAEAMHLPLPAEARKRLLDAYLTLKPWPDTVAALKRLRNAGVRITTIANFSDKMLRANAEHAGIADLFDIGSLTTSIGSPQSASMRRSSWADSLVSRRSPPR